MPIIAEIGKIPARRRPGRRRRSRQARRRLVRALPPGPLGHPVRPGRRRGEGRRAASGPRPERRSVAGERGDRRAPGPVAATSRGSSCSPRRCPARASRPRRRSPRWRWRRPAPTRWSSTPTSAARWSRTTSAPTHSPSLADRAELSVDRLELDEIVQPTEVPTICGSRPAASRRARWAAGSRQRKEVAAEAAARGGTVLIDSSPLRVSNDPIDLLAAVDEVILVVRAGRTTVKSLEDTMELLEMHHAPTLGIVLIGTLADPRDVRLLPVVLLARRRRADSETGPDERGRRWRRPPATGEPRRRRARAAPRSTVAPTPVGAAPVRPAPHPPDLTGPRRRLSAAGPRAQRPAHREPR